MGLASRHDWSDKGWQIVCTGRPARQLSFTHALRGTPGGWPAPIMPPYPTAINVFTWSKQ